MLKNSQNIQESIYIETLGQSGRKLYQCRICLEQMTKDQLLQICDCKGSNSAIHKKCLVEWIAKSNKKYRRLLQYYYKCEICLTQIQLQTQLIVSCKEIQKIEGNLIQQTNACTIMSAIMIFVAIITFGLCLYFAVIQSKYKTINRFLIFGIVVSSIAILFTIIFYLCQQVFEFNIKVLDVKSKERSITQIVSNKFKKNQVMPIPINLIAKKQVNQSQQQIFSNKNQQQTLKVKRRKRNGKLSQKTNQQNQQSLNHIKELFSIQ